MYVLKAPMYVVVLFFLKSLHILAVKCHTIETMNKRNVIKIAITVVSIFGIVIHLLWPYIKIDAATFGLLLLALIPWLAPIIKSIEIPGIGKVELQQEIDSEAIKPGGKSEKSMQLFDAKGFYTYDGITHLINDSDLVKSNEKVVDCLQIFRTERQHTWLAVTPEQIFCILDYEKTRSSGRLIQWRLPIENASPIKAKQTPKGSHVVDIGPRSNWYYSVNMYPKPEELENKIIGMVDKGIGTHT